MHIDRSSRVRVPSNGRVLLRSILASIFLLTPVAHSQAPSALSKRLEVPVAFRTRMEAKERTNALMATFVDSRGKLAAEKTKQCEEAIAKSITHLIGTQKPDGSWGSSKNVLVTGWALLALVGQGDLEQQKERKDAVQKAVAWLVLQGKEQQGWYRSGSDKSGHGIALAAMAEYRAISGDATVDASLLQAVKVLQAAQKDGWGLDYEDSPDADAPTTVASLFGLHTALLARVPAPDLEKSIEKAARALLEESTDWPQKRTTTGVGAAMKVTLNSAWNGALYYAALAAPKVRKVNRTDMTRLMTGMRPELWSKNGRAYEVDYLRTTAATLLGGSVSMRWNTMLREVFIGAQTEEGTWRAPLVNNYFSSHGLEAHTDADGDAWRTALPVMMLQAPYHVRLP